MDGWSTFSFPFGVWCNLACDLVLLLLVSGSGVGLEDIDSFLAVAKKHGVTLADADGASFVRRRSAVPPFF